MTSGRVVGKAEEPVEVEKEENEEEVVEKEKYAGG